jgi:hypothetical protein
MKHIIILIAILILSLGFSSCRWSEKKKKEFECECKETKIINGLVVLIQGFEKDNIDSVLIEEYNANIKLDSFRIKIDNKLGQFYINKQLNVSYKYQFIFPNNNVHVLENMEMIMWPQWTNINEDYGCIMGNFTLDGIVYKKTGNPKIVNASK